MEIHKQKPQDINGTLKFKELGKFMKRKIDENIFDF